MNEEKFMKILDEITLAGFFLSLLLIMAAIGFNVYLSINSQQDKNAEIYRERIVAQRQLDKQ